MLLMVRAIVIAYCRVQQYAPIVHISVEYSPLADRRKTTQSINLPVLHIPYNTNISALKPPDVCLWGYSTRLLLSLISCQIYPSRVHQQVFGSHYEMSL